MASISQFAIVVNLVLISLYLRSDVLEASHHIHSEAEVVSVLLGDVDGSGTTNGYDRKDIQPYRTAYHFQPPKNWMNDPNGPMVYKGIYHLFYQYNPKGAIWGNIVWAHSISTDLINWKSLPFALTPSQKSDIVGVWSGSITIIPDGRPAIFYTGVDSEQKQVQDLAFPRDISDPMLEKWVKAPENPLIEPNAENKINASSFRDPTTAWIGQDGNWRIIVGSKIDRRGLALLFKSKDFVLWTMEDHPLYYVDNNGMWECPDFYPVSKDGQQGVDTSSPEIKPETVKYILKVSLDDTRKDYYTVGAYDKVKDVYVPDEGSIHDDSGLRYDYGKFYASKTFFDSVKKRRILWGWVNESSPWQYDVKKGWHGLQNIPRAVWLDISGKQLVQWPVEEVMQLRTTKVGFSNRSLPQGSSLKIGGITASQADIEVSFKIPTKSVEKAEVLISSAQSAQLLCSQKGATVAGVLGPFGMKVLATQDMKEYTAVFFRIFKTDTKYAVLMCSDQSSSSLDNNNDKTTYGAFVDVEDTITEEELNLRILIDHSIVESFGGNGKSVITARVYPTKAVGKQAQVFAFNGGDESVFVSKLCAWTWSMKPAKIN